MLSKFLLCFVTFVEGVNVMKNDQNVNIPRKTADKPTQKPQDDKRPDKHIEQDKREYGSENPRQFDNNSERQQNR